MIPAWVQAEIDRRGAEAREAYREAVSRLPVCQQLISEDDYVRQYLERLPPIQWVSGGAA